MKKTLAAIAVAACALTLPNISASAGGASVTSGDFHSFNGGPAGISGRAQMVRTASGSTIVTVHVAGLEPGAEYDSHVHLQACADGLAGKHYRFDEAVPGGALNGYEIWPGPFTANAGGNARGKASVEATAGVHAVSVVVHAPAPGGEKIACADLS